MNRTESRSPATLSPVALTAEEAAAVAVALAVRPEGQYAEAGRSALEKVLSSLEPDPRLRAQLLARCRGVSGDACLAAEIRSTLERAVAGSVVLALHYRDGNGVGSDREVEPQLLVRSRDHLFLVAWCRERQALRWFREDRIEAAVLTGETAARRDLTGLGAPPVTGHPAGRARKPGPVAPPPRLVVLPGGRL